VIKPLDSTAGTSSSAPEERGEQRSAFIFAGRSSKLPAEACAVWGAENEPGARFVISLPARAIGHAACRRGLSVYNGTLADVLEKLHASRADGTYRKASRRVTSPDLLLLDDAGFSDLDREYANEMFRLVCARHRQRSTIVVTNLPFKEWGEFMPSPAQAVAIADRLIDQATILRFTGKPYRQARDIHGAPLDGE